MFYTQSASAAVSGFRLKPVAVRRRTVTKWRQGRCCLKSWKWTKECTIKYPHTTPTWGGGDGGGVGVGGGGGCSLICAGSRGFQAVWVVPDFPLGTRYFCISTLGGCWWGGMKRSTHWASGSTWLLWIKPHFPPTIRTTVSLPWPSYGGLPASKVHNLNYLHLLFNYIEIITMQVCAFDLHT